MSSNRYRGERRRNTEYTAEDNHLGIERPAHLAPHGDSAPFHRLTALFEWCSKKKLELRRRYLATWFDVGSVLPITYLCAVLNSLTELAQARWARPVSCHAPTSTTSEIPFHYDTYESTKYAPLW